jgi:large subunit ribosomal protein L23
MFDDHRDVLLAPVISEKSYGLLDQNKYTFDVHPDANKTQIKIAVEKVFNVKVTDVNTLNRQGKRKRTRFGYGQRKSIKRAVVTLREGDRIEVFGGPAAYGEHENGYPQLQADDPGPPWLVRRRLRRDHSHGAGEVAGASAAQQGRP